MSVKQKDIDLNKILDKAAGKTGSEHKKNNAEIKTAPELASILDAAATGELKKKDVGKPSVNPSKDLPDGGAAVPGTTSTTKQPELKWEDNPLNPVKAANDYAASNPLKKESILFKDTDDIKVNELSQKYGAAKASDVEVVPANNAVNPLQRQYKSVQKNPVALAIDNANNIETAIKEKIATIDQNARSEKGTYYTPGMYKEKEDLEKDLTKTQLLKKKAAARLVPSGDKEIEAIVRVTDPTNSFERLAGWLEPAEATKPTDTKTKLSPQFVTGLNSTKYTEPVVYERLTEAIKTGRPISDSQVAQLTALGAKIDAAKLEEAIEKNNIETAPEQNKLTQYNNQLIKLKTDLDGYEATVKSGKQLSAGEIADYKTKVAQYNSLATEAKPIQEKLAAKNDVLTKKADALQKVSEDNLLNRPEVLRAFFAEKVGDYLDELGKIKQSAGEMANPGIMIANYFLGHTLNYSDEEIAGAAAEIAKREGLEVTDPRIQNVIKELQVNEGWMLGMNSVPKSGGIRELVGGFKNKIADTVTGIDRLVGRGKSADDAYIESQSQGNLDVAQKRLAAEDKGVRGVVNSVVAGAGEFGAQALMMYGAAGISGKAGRALTALETPVLSGAIEGTAANVVGEAGLKLLGKALTKFQNPIGVYTSAKAMSYDSALKTALSYTSDNEKAKATAYIMSDLEAWTELILSPLEIAQGIVRKFSRAEATSLMKILEDKSLKNDPSKLSSYIQKFLKGSLATGEVAVAEIGEEEITQLADYLANQYLNPNSKAFKDRNLMKEFGETAYQTGLSMAVPALLNGIGAAQANTFSKGALLVASQNRQKIVDGLNQDLFDKKIDQQTYNTKIQLVNTAFVAHNQTPAKKADGTGLSTDEKANYVWSRTTEAYMEKQMNSTTDAAQKELWKDKIAKQQEYRKQIIGLAEEKPEVPEYTIDDKPVSREEILKAIEEKPDGNYFVANDEEVQAALRKIGGIDDKTDSEVASAIITIGGKTYEGKNHAEAILKAKADGKDISQVDRKRDGKFKLSDGTIIDRAEAKKKFGADRAEQLIEQDEAADNANKEYRKSDKDLVSDVEEKGIKNYERTNIKELKEQALQAPASLKNQFDDEELVVDLIAKNTPEQIENAIKYQQERIENDPNMDEVSMTGIDQHIQLLEKGLEKNKQFSELEEKAADLEKEGKPLSKLETLKAKKKLAEVEVPGETVDEKLKHIADKPEGFAPDLVALAEKRFPKEVPAEKTTPVSSTPPTEQSGKDAVEIKNEGTADAPTNESVTERLNINNPFYQKVTDALEKLGLIKKYNAETKEGDVIGGYVQSDGKGGFASGDMYFKADGSISYIKGDSIVTFDKNGNVTSHNAAEVKSKNQKAEIEGKKESIKLFEKTRDSEDFKYKTVNEYDALGNTKKVKRLKTAQELKESTDKINEQIDKAKSELAELEKQQSGKDGVVGKEKVKEHIDSLADDNYLFTHVTTEENAKSITENGMSVSLGTGISSTLTALGKGSAAIQAERLMNGEVVHRDLNNNSVAIIAIPKHILDKEGSVRDKAEALENWLVENGYEKGGKVNIPIEFNAGYLSGETFIQNKKTETKQDEGGSFKVGKIAQPSVIPNEAAADAWLKGNLVNESGQKRLDRLDELEAVVNKSRASESDKKFSIDAINRERESLSTPKVKEVVQPSNDVEVSGMQHTKDELKQIAKEEGIDNAISSFKKDLDAKEKRLEELTRYEKGKLPSQKSKSKEVENLNKRISEVKKDIENLEKIKSERAEKIAEIEKQKQAEINEVTKPLVKTDSGLTLFDLAATTEENRQEHGDIRQKLFSLRDLINCLWA